MPLDVETAYKFLIAQPTVSLRVFSSRASKCGVNQSVHLALKHPKSRRWCCSRKSPTWNGRNFLRAHPSLPLFLATAEDDTDPGVSDLMQWLSTFSTNAHTKFVRLQDRRHGVEMFAAHPELPATIVDWGHHRRAFAQRRHGERPPNVSPETQFLDSLDLPGAAANSAQLYAAASAKNPNGPVVSELVLNRLGYDHLQDGDKKGAIAISSSTPACTPIHPMFTTASRRVPCRRAERFGAAECAEGD